MTVPQPFVALTISGVPLALKLGQGLKEFSYTDEHHGQVDEASFTLADPKGLYRGPWGIDEGTEVSAVMGYARGIVVPCGLFSVGENGARGSGGEGDVAYYHAQSAFTSKELRTVRSKGYDERALKFVVQDIANRHGLRLVGDVPDVTFKRLTQDKQSDLAFATQLANDWGCYFTCKGDQLVFTSRASIEQVEPVRVIDLIEGSGVISYDLRRATHKMAAVAEVSYLNPKTQKLVAAQVRDDRVKSGDTLKISTRAESADHAKRLAAAKLAQNNDGLGTGELSMVGDPMLVAGQVIALGPSFGRYAKRYLITSAAHVFNASGYVSDISIKELI